MVVGSILIVAATQAVSSALAGDDVLVSQNLGANAYTASSTWDTHMPQFAFDGDSATLWNAGNDAVQWLEVDLGASYHVHHFVLEVAQTPDGDTTHEILLSSTPIGDAAVGATVAHTFQGFTVAGQVLEATLPESFSARFAQIRTLSSPSWIAWREFKVFATAATLTVTNLNDSGPGSLRQAIADAAPGDTINFAVNGTITLTSGELVITNGLTINGPGVANLTISGNDASRVFSVQGVTASILRMAVSHGRAAHGGAVYLDSTSVLTMSNCSVTESEDITGDYSGGGGGVMSEGALRIIDSTISGNHSHSMGGGVTSLGTLTLINSTVSSNDGGSAGGGIWQAGSQTSLVNCTVSGNTVMGNGGGIQVTGGATLTCTNCTITANNGWNAGGGFFISPGSVALRNSILAGNVALSRPDCDGAITSDDYNLIQNTDGATITGDATHNIYDQDPLLGPLQDNGGPTWTHALLPGSPAIDAGHSGGLVADQRGFPRPVDNAGVANASGGDGSDIGAYEACAETNLVTNTNDSGPGSLRQAILAANACPGQNTIEFAPSAYGTITLTTGELAITDDLTINGPGATNLTVSGNQSSRVFLINSGVVSVSGMTIANGMIVPESSSPFAGAGIANLATLAISDSVICSNTNPYLNVGGGGIYSGGANYNAGGTLTVRSCTISSNHALNGAGIWSVASTLSIFDSTLTDNHANDGGGIRSDGGSLVIAITTISGNSAGDGGGILGSATIRNCTIVNNNAWWYGGGGIMGSADIRGSIVASNSATQGADGPDCLGEINSSDYNLIQNTNGVTITGATTHNIYDQDLLLGPLQDNGGPTWTHALLTGSPAIGAGDPSFTPPPDFDQRGPGFPRVASGRIDIGAFEYMYVCPGDADCDGIPDSWMQLYFGHATGQAGDNSRATDDRDGDGMSNLQEYLTGTNPTDSGSAFRIISVVQEGDDIRVTWNAGGGTTNVLQAATGDVNGGHMTSFADLNEPIVILGTGDTITNSVDTGGTTNFSSRYYRVRLVP